jgi:hypothetical protein
MLRGGRNLNDWARNLDEEGEKRKKAISDWMGGGQNIPSLFGAPIDAQKKATEATISGTEATTAAIKMQTLSTESFDEILGRG